MIDCKQRTSAQLACSNTNPSKQQKIDLRLFVFLVAKAKAKCISAFWGALSMIDLFNVQLFDERACLARAETEIKQT